MMYGSFSAWNTYRTLHPLLTFLFPEIQSRICASMMDVYLKTGSLPKDPMIGNHSIIVLADSYLKGIHFEHQDLLKNAIEATLKKAFSEDSAYKEYCYNGFVTSAKKENVSTTLSYAIDDYYISRLGYKDFINKPYCENFANAWRLFDNSRKLFVPDKYLNTKTPLSAFGYKESDAWNSSFDMYFDNNRLLEEYGGRQLLKNILDSGWNKGFFLFDNETAFHLPYIYALCGASEEQQAAVDEIINHRFSINLGGIPGNDDLGSMSSWLVFSMMGIYPLMIDKSDYVTGRCYFDSVRIHRTKGDLTIKNSLSNNEPSRFVKNNDLFQSPGILLPIILNAKKFVAGNSPYNVQFKEEGTKRFNNLNISFQIKLSDKDSASNADVLSKGDLNVFQLNNNSVLTFFAGGWGHGAVSYDISEADENHWHDVKGVYKNGILKLYWDGHFVNQQKAFPETNTFTSINWVQGKNNEFPGERIFHGELKRVIIKE